MTKVVHCKKEPYDILIDRTTQWGNPYKISKTQTRETVLALYKNWLWGHIQSGTIPTQDIAALHGKTLGCWCAPKPCHGNILAQAAEWANNTIDKPANT